MIQFYNFDLDCEINKIIACEHSKKRKGNGIYNYSTDKIICDLYNLEGSSGLNVYTYHGINIRNFETGCEDAFFCKNPVLDTRKSQENYLTDRGVEAYTIGSLFVRYRRKHGIELADKARGTIVFPSHSTRLIKALLDWDCYADEVASLPKKYQPVSVCMYWQDLLHGHHKPFLKRGLKIYTAGYYLDVDFVDNFYEIVRNFRYSTGNTIGSNSFYLVELGIPYFLTGCLPKYQNHGDPARILGEYYDGDQDGINASAYKYFPRIGNDAQVISSDLLIYVNEMLGVNQETESKLMKEVLNESIIDNGKTNSLELTIQKLSNEAVMVAKRVKNKLFDFYRGSRIKIYFRKNRLLFDFCEKAKKLVNSYREVRMIRSRKRRCVHFHEVNGIPLAAMKISTHLTFEEKERLFQLATIKKIGVFVELGSYYGASSVYIAAALNQSKAVLYCVDTWKNDTMPEGACDTFNEFLNNTASFSRVIRTLRGTSELVGLDFEPEIDFLFVDADHSYESVKTDISIWLPKLKEDAIIVFHDTGWAEGVNRVIDEFIRPRARCEGQLPNMYWAWL